MLKKTLSACISILAIVGTIFVIIFAVNLFMDSSFSIPIIKEPRFVIVSQSGNDGMEGLNYVDYVTCYVRNEGNGAGTAIVTAELGNRVLTQNIYLASSQFQEVKFTFDTSLLGSMFSSTPKYRCSVRKI